jgi:response regulator RpfG family c-di-GMP phosphodiesterase
MTGAICEVAQMLGARLTAAEPVVAALTAVYERWDGKGLPGGLAGEAIPFTVG